MKAALLVIAFIAAALVSPVTAQADTPYGNFELRIDGRYDFHTWLWVISRCDGQCVTVQAVPQPIAKAFPYRGTAQLADGRYTLTVDVPDGLRCGNVYYGPVIPTRDVYSWDATTRSGTLESSFAVGCDGAPGGTFTYPFQLVRL
ncbi:hypothetical protein [Mycolicibacterium elephantis]|uniref:Lipocalin-like domain-containing protein n=1 Tax=Mycolicibacterium elephantis DSM 44368 TaxID=1335622 RepID=A0A439E0V3_9MYCO|nr:hypothetical protein [Mycolicibacterium elephantis]MCV7221624.1 hypothetical protein [Mycolicibacterium elephantis]OBA66152.1 hypothetical protein A5633_02785 [Mycolicibacterium elephantis]RWA24063.1 hypothetical protein MELE44368_02295 [Mycolicibacterium elephantis DSM 44368]